MKVFRPALDALKRQAEIKEEYPDYASTAHKLIMDCLVDNDEERLKIYLGEKNESSEQKGLSVDRTFLYLTNRDVCRQLEKVDKENLHHLWSDCAWDWYVRRLLEIPFKIIDQNEEYKGVNNFTPSQALLATIILLPNWTYPPNIHAST